MSKLRLVIGLTTIATVLIAAILFYAPKERKMTKIHKLEYPLIVSSDQQSKITHMLPKGTTLYYDKAYPEGFTRYKVYINIDRMPLKLEDLQDPTEIIPIDAAAPDKDDLTRLIQDYPLTKSDLESILSSKKISEEEIKEVFEKYIR